jgi:flagellar basal-body rod protein FlgG
MNYGLYLSANGITSSQHRMNVLANNLANVNTTAFKPSQVVLGERAREPEALQTMTNSRELLEQLGGGTRIAFTGIDLAQGSIEATKIKTDLALQGAGFLHLEDGDGGKTMLTRDGRLRFDGSGVLRHTASNLAVLDEKGEPIQLGDEEQMNFEGFGPRGELLDRENPFSNLGRLALVNAPSRSLRLDGNNTIETKDKLEQAKNVEVRGSSLESSTADPVTGMVELIKLTREIEMNSRMIQDQDAMIGQAVTSLGRVV